MSSTPSSPPGGATAAAAGGVPSGIVHRRAPGDPDYTEFGIKIHKLRLTLKVQKRASSAHSATPRSASASGGGGNINVNPGHYDRRGRARLNSEERPRAALRASSIAARGARGAHPRPRSTASDVSLRHLDLDANAGSRRPVTGASTGGGGGSGPDAVDGNTGSIAATGRNGSRVANWEFQVIVNT